MPVSGARSGTKPNREGPAGTGRVMVTLGLVCGHTIDALAVPLATKAGGRRLFSCPDGCGLQWEKA